MEHCALHMLWMNIAREYGKLRDCEKTIAAFKKAYYHAYKMDHFKSGKYTSMFANTGDYSKEKFSRNFEKSYVEWLKNVVAGKEFDFIKDTEAWNEMVEVDCCKAVDRFLY